MNAQIQTRYLSDGSEATDLVIYANGKTIRFSCVDSLAAHYLREQIELSSVDVEVEP